MTAAPTGDVGHELVGAIPSRKYSLKRVLGSGGMGTVFESTHPEDGRAIAVKLLASEWREDAEVKRRFVDEGRVCQRLVHPNIVRVFDVGEAEDGSPYIVMELLDGAPLSSYTRAGARLPMGQAATILQGVLGGLAAAHAQGVVHRDLKPENVILSRDPSGAYAPKILDFGIAKVMDLAGGMGSKTKTGVLLGTPAYMSPEQVRNSKDVDARSDLWSAGVLLYEMLTGRVAFPAPTEYARLAAVLNATPAPVEQVDRELARLAPFLEVALQKDRAQRYPSALEMARALAAAMQLDASAAQPLSQLPAVQSVWMPAAATQAAAPPVDPAPQTRTVAISPAAAKTPRAPASKGPGGTLTSRPQGAVVDPAPQVVIAKHATLPSENLPMFAAPGRRGVAPWAVLVLVLVALAAGFGFGLAFARMR